MLDFGEYEGHLFLVMELVEGGSLARVLAASGTLPAGRVARLAAQAAAGLAAAHRQGIVHRDIKPANLPLDADGTLKIGDFGIARFLDDPGAALTATGQIVGTSLYLAPERALGKPAGPASDMYALGCLLYQLLTGRPPFQAGTALAVLPRHPDTAPAPPRHLGSELPPAFENYLLGLLAKEPEDRPTAAQTSDWFASGAWRRTPQPLPQELPDKDRRPAPGTAPKPHPTAPAAEEAGWKTTVHPAAPRTRGTRLGSVRRFRVAALLGGIALFVVALHASMSWFSPDTGSTHGPQADQSPTSSPSTPLATASAPADTAPVPDLTPSATPSSEQTAGSAGGSTTPDGPPRR